MRRFVLSAILLLFATHCRAQINCPLTGQKALACIIPNQLNLTPGAEKNLAFLNEAIGSQVSDLPLASPASGVIFTIDPKLNTPVPSNATLGPVLTQRAETIGRHKVYIAFTYQYFNFNEIDGVSLKNIPIFLNYQNGTVNAVTATNNRLNLRANQYTTYFTFGLTSHMDISVAMPIVSVSEQFTTNGFEYNLSNPSAPVTPINNYSQQGSVTAVGIGDFTFAGKYWLWRPEHGGLSVGAELRAPTGSTQNFHGAGTIGFRPYLTYTYGTRFSPHVNLAYEVNGNTNLITNANGGSGQLPNRFLFSGGVDWGVRPWITLAVDVLGQEVFNAQRIRIVAAPPVTVPSFDVTYSTISTYQGNFTRADAAGGLKFKPFPNYNLIFTGNVLVRLNNNGLRASLTPLAAVSYTF